MPTYCQHCLGCGNEFDSVRVMADVDKMPPCPECAGMTELVLKPPAVHDWSGGKKFPNLSPHGDGSMTFHDKGAYNRHLREKGVLEVDYGGQRKTPAGSRKVMTDGRER